MFWKLFSISRCQPSDEELDLLLRQALKGLGAQRPSQGGWRRLQARIAATHSEAETSLQTLAFNERRLPFIGVPSLWEPLMRPQAWSRLTI